MARITPSKFQERLTAGEELFIIDLRNGAAEEADFIPHAVRISPNELAARRHEIPLDREIILFCS